MPGPLLGVGYLRVRVRHWPSERTQQKVTQYVKSQAHRVTTSGGNVQRERLDEKHEEPKYTMEDRYCELYGRRLKFYRRKEDVLNGPVMEEGKVNFFCQWDDPVLLSKDANYGLQLRFDGGKAMFVSALNRLDLERWVYLLTAALDSNSEPAKELKRQRHKEKARLRKIEEEKERKRQAKLEKRKLKYEEMLRQKREEDERIAKLTPLERRIEFGTVDEETQKILEARRRRARRLKQNEERVKRATYDKRLRDAAGGRVEGVDKLVPKVTERYTPKPKLHIPPPDAAPPLPEEEPMSHRIKYRSRVKDDEPPPLPRDHEDDVDDSDGSDSTDAPPLPPDSPPPLPTHEGSAYSSRYTPSFLEGSDDDGSDEEDDSVFSTTSAVSFSASTSSVSVSGGQRLHRLNARNLAKISRADDGRELFTAGMAVPRSVSPPGAKAQSRSKQGKGLFDSSSDDDGDSLWSSASRPRVPSGTSRASVRSVASSVPPPPPGGPAGNTPRTSIQEKIASRAKRMEMDAESRMLPTQLANPFHGPPGMGDLLASIRQGAQLKQVQPTRVQQTLGQVSGGSKAAAKLVPPPPPPPPPSTNGGMITPDLLIAALGKRLARQKEEEGETSLQHPSGSLTPQENISMTGSARKPLSSKSAITLSPRLSVGEDSSSIASNTPSSPSQGDRHYDLKSTMSKLSITPPLPSGHSKREGRVPSSFTHSPRQPSPGGAETSESGSDSADNLPSWSSKPDASNAKDGLSRSSPSLTLPAAPQPVPETTTRAQEISVVGGGLLGNALSAAMAARGLVGTQGDETESASDSDDWS